MVIEAVPLSDVDTRVHLVNLKKDAGKLVKVVANAVDESLEKPLKHFLKAAASAGHVEAVGIGLLGVDHSVIISLFVFLDYGVDILRVNDGAIKRMRGEIAFLQAAVRPNNRITTELAFIDTRAQMTESEMRTRLHAALSRSEGNLASAFLAVSSERR